MPLNMSLPMQRLIFTAMLSLSPRQKTLSRWCLPIMQSMLLFMTIKIYKSLSATDTRQRLMRALFNA